MPVQARAGVFQRLTGLMMKHVHGMMTCREFEAFVQRYLDDELPAAQRRMFEWHIRLCRECRDYLRAYERSVEIGRALLSGPDEPVPPDVPEDLVKAILSARDAD